MAIFEVFSDSLFRRPRARAQGEHTHHAQAGNEPETGGVPCVVTWRRQCGPGACLPLAAAEPGPSQESGRPTAIAQNEAVQRRLAACSSGSPDCQGRDPRRFQERRPKTELGRRAGLGSFSPQPCAALSSSRKPQVGAKHRASQGSGSSPRAEDTRATWFAMAAFRVPPAAGRAFPSLKGAGGVAEAGGPVCLCSCASMFGLSCLIKLNLLFSQTAGVCSATRATSEDCRWRAPGLWSVLCGRPHIPEERWPRRHQGMPATWAEPQGLVLNSEGSLSFLRLNFIMKGVLGHNSLTSKF